jgi:hypothetical protein
MTVMQIREVTSCAVHGRTIIVLEDVSERFRLTFYADLGEAQRLARVIERAPCVGQPVYDFIQSRATPPMPSPWRCGQTSPSMPPPQRSPMRSDCHPPRAFPMNMER